LNLAERLAPNPPLIPGDVDGRARMFGLANELLGENGLVWVKRLLMVDGPPKALPADDPIYVISVFLVGILALQLTDSKSATVLTVAFGGYPDVLRRCAPIAFQCARPSGLHIVCSGWRGSRRWRNGGAVYVSGTPDAGRLLPGSEGGRRVNRGPRAVAWEFVSR